MNIGLLGCGAVGTALVELMQRNQRLIRQRTGANLVLRRIFMRNPAKSCPVPRDMITQNPADIVEADDIDMVIEVMGGVEPAHTYLSQALSQNKDVVTSNKALLTHSGQQLFKRAAWRGVHLGFEATVCSGIPVMRVLRHGLSGNRITTICGIVNCTTNYILTRMSEDGIDLQQALEMARQRGFPEPDPYWDLSGEDGAQKLVLMSQVAYGTRMTTKDVVIDGIFNIDRQDIIEARKWGYAIKHLAWSQRVGHTLSARVHPALVPLEHPLAAVRDEFNAVMLYSDATGELTLQGRGTGPMPGASALLADIIEIATAQPGRAHFIPKTERLDVVEDVSSRFYMRFPIIDRPGVIGHISTVLGQHGISITQATASPASQHRNDIGDATILSYPCLESTLRSAIDEISRFGILSGKPVIIRIFEGANAISGIPWESALDA